MRAADDLSDRTVMLVLGLFIAVSICCFVFFFSALHSAETPVVYGDRASVSLSASDARESSYSAPVSGGGDVGLVVVNPVTG